MYNNICGRLINGDLTHYISVIAIEESILSLYQLTRKANSKIFVTIYVRNKLEFPSSGEMMCYNLH